MKRKQKTTQPARLKQAIGRHLKLAFVPHRANQFRPHAVRRYGLAALLLLIISTQTAYNAMAAGTVPGAKTTITSKELLKSTNVQRAYHGLRPLRLSSELSNAAALKADDMFTQQYWAHVAPDGRTPWYWLEKAQYDYRAAGENLARGFTTSGAAMSAWMSSFDHRKNILGESYTDVGFAVVDGMLEGKPTTLVVALYGQPAATPLATAAPVAAPPHQTLGLTARFGVALQSMTPAAMASVIVLAVFALIALAAHMYRHKMPTRLREGWHRRHHGLLKAGGMVSLAAVMIILYSGGQI